MCFLLVRLFFNQELRAEMGADNRRTAETNGAAPERPLAGRCPVPPVGGVRGTIRRNFHLREAPASGRRLHNAICGHAGKKDRGEYETQKYKRKGRDQNTDPPWTLNNKVEYRFILPAHGPSLSDYRYLTPRITSLPGLPVKHFTTSDTTPLE